MAFDHGYGLPGMLARESELQQLLQLLKRIYQREVPAAMQTADTAAADMKAAWGPHKWTLRMWMRLLSRYAAPQSYSLAGPWLICGVSQPGRKGWCLCQRCRRAPSTAL